MKMARLIENPMKTTKYALFQDPLCASFSSDFTTPVALFHKLSEESANAFMFESTEGDGRLARYSFLGVDPILSVSFKGEEAHLFDLAGKTVAVEKTVNPVKYLSELLAAHVHDLKQPSALLAEFPFTSGLVGYMGYGAVHFLDG